MPNYDFQCNTCQVYDSDESTPHPYVYEVTLSMSADKKAACPQCGTADTKRVFTTSALHQGLTASMKTSGTTKSRVDMGKFMRDQRDKRKREYGPNTREGSSNELWTGNEVKDGVIAGPKPQVPQSLPPKQ